MSRLHIRPMTIEDYPAVVQLWQSTKGIGFSDADSAESIGRFLARNPNLSLVAYDNERLVGAVLCGHDGRRGYLHRLAVDPSYRKQGLGRKLVEHCLAGLSAAHIDKCHLFVFAENDGARAFWKKEGWMQRIELQLMSKYTS